MSLKYSNIFNDRENPREFYEELNRNIYEQSFENAPNYYATNSKTPIEYEFPYGSNKWHKVEGRIDDVVLANTGTKSGNDFKQFIFKPSFSLEITNGTKLRWKNNIWLVQNTDCATSDMHKSCVAKRCNNILRFYDKNGNKIYEPCILEDVIRFTNTNRTQDIITSRGEYVLFVQRNSNTIQLKANDRFLFGTPEQRACFRIYGSGIRNYLNTITEDESSPSLIQIYLEHYQIDKQLDDLEEGFCNAYKNKENNNTKNEPETEEYAIKINPNVEYILSGDGQNEQEYEVYLYKDGVKQSDIFLIEDSSIDVPKNKYEITLLDGNHFKVKNIGMFMDRPVIITCSCREFSETIKIELRGIF